jgi:2-alkyl-3-oxoalkanoate reductase
LSQGPVLVAGASGFLGGHLAGFLRKRGYQVRALDGDVSERASLDREMQGVKWVFNCAAKISDWGPREAFLAVNRDGVASLVAACQGAGVERLVHWGSLTVLGLPRRGQLVTEDSQYPTRSVDDYTASRIAGERLVREAHGQRGLSTVVVRSGAIWGEGEPDIMPRIVRLLRAGRMVYVGDGANHVALTHVENLSLGIALAAEKQEAAGRVYHVLDGEDLTSREVIDGVAEAIGVPKPRRSVPYGIVYGVAFALELSGRLLRLEEPPAMTRYGVRFVASDCRYDRTRAKSELGYEPTVSFRQGLEGVAHGFAKK